MTRVLFGWEFGGGLGHLATLLPIAKGLVGSHEPVFAVKQLSNATSLLADQGEMVAAATLLQAPRWPTQSKSKGPEVLTHSLADTLKIHGYHDRGLLYGLARGWRGILRLVDPSLVIADYSPTLLLAARGVVPTIALGTGYSTPPGGRPLPPMRPWEKQLPATSRAAEREVLQAVQFVQRQLGCPAAAFLGDLFNGDRTFVCTIPEFDPYRDYREEPTLMPFNLPDFGLVRPLAERPEGRIFVYLPANHPHLVTTLAAIRKLRLTGDIFVPGLPEEVRRRFAAPSLIFHERPLALEQVLPGARVAIHHGGHATSYAALRSGTPQLLLINNLERLVTSYGLHQLNCAIAINADGKMEVDGMADCLRRLLQTDEIHRSAQAGAESLAARPATNPVKTILEACQDMLP